MSFLVCVAAGVVAIATPTDDNVIVFTPAFFGPSAPATAYEMIIRLPGFSFASGTDVRGLTDASGNVLIDGQPPVSKNDQLEDALKRIPASAVERIELIRGGAVGIDMRGKSVIANVVRKSARGLRGAAVAESYLTEQGDALAGVNTEAQWSLSDVNMELSVQAGGKPDDKVTAGSRALVAPDGALLSQSDRDAFGKTERAWVTGALESPLGAGRVKVNATYQRSPYDSRVLEVQPQSGAAETELIEEDPRKVEMGAQYLRKLGSGAEFEAVAFRQWSDARINALNTVGNRSREFLLDRDTDETVLRGQISWNRAGNLRAEAGAEAVSNTLLSETAFFENGIVMPIPAGNVRVRERRNEVFASATMRLIGTLTLEGGVRQEWTQISARGDTGVDKTMAFTKPRLAATWDFADSYQLRARIAREVDQLNFDDFVASSALVGTGVVLAGNPDLDPQQAWVGEVALEKRFWGDGAATVELRRSELRDVIDRIPVRDAADRIIADAPGNIGEGRLDELTLRLTIPLDRLGFAGADLYGDATFLQSRVTDPTTGESREISQSFPRQIELRLRQDVPGTRFTWGIRAFTSMTEHSYRYSEIETSRLGRWVTPFVEFAPADGWLIHAELQSVANGDLQRIRYVYAGSHAAHALAYTDRRTTKWGRALYVSLRKTF